MAYNPNAYYSYYGNNKRMSYFGGGENNNRLRISPGQNRMYYYGKPPGGFGSYNGKVEYSINPRNYRDIKNVKTGYSTSNKFHPWTRAADVYGYDGSVFDLVEKAYKQYDSWKEQQNKLKILKDNRNELRDYNSRHKVDKSRLTIRPKVSSKTMEQPKMTVTGESGRRNKRDSLMLYPGNASSLSSKKGKSSVLSGIST